MCGIFNRELMKRLLFMVFCLLSFSINAQSINVDNFYGKWQLDKYSDDEQYYHLPKKETKDYIDLGKNMTFTAVSEGEKTSGTWLFNTNGKYIEFRYENGDKEKIFIYFLSEKSMVITYDVDEYRVWEMHFIKQQ